MADYEAPTYFSADPDRKLGWLREAIEEGESYLRNQRAYTDIDKAMDIMAGEHIPDAPQALSNVKTNRTKRQCREIVASLGNLRIVPAYKTDVAEYAPHAIVLNKMFMAWWFATFADRRFRAALQWAVAGGTGYISPRWDKDFHVPGRGDIRLDVLGPRDVLPIQLPRSHDLQQAYAVILRTEVPLSLARRTYPQFAEEIKASRDRPTGLRRAVSRAAKYLSPVLRRFGTGREKDEEPPFPVVDVYNVYILDDAINRSGQEIRMGQPGTTWEYMVPYLGQEIPLGGDAYRRATEEDCKLFPMRRLLVATDNLVLEDGTSKWWHSKVPAVPFRVDDWPWDYLGYSLTRENADIEASNVQLMRQIYDAIRGRLGVPLGYDRNSVAKALAESVDPRIPYQRIGLDFAFGSEVFKPLIPHQYYDVPSYALEFIQGQEERMDYQMGVRDIAALAKARQLPASDSLEKLMEIAGPLIQDISRNMEGSVKEFGELWKSLAFQFYSSARKVQLLGQNAMVEEDFDFDPGNMIPSHLPGEDAGRPSSLARWQRARWHQNNFLFHVTPYSLHQMTQTTRQLKLLQLSARGFPIDPWSLAEAFDLGNFGPAPQGATTGMERWVAWMHMQRELQQELGEALGAAGLPGIGQGRGGGRPPTYQTPPELSVKDGGTRSTIRTSPK